MNLKKSAVSLAVVTLLLSIVVVATNSAPRLTQPSYAASMKSLFSPVGQTREDVEPPSYVSATLTDGECAQDGADISWPAGSADSGVAGYAIYINGVFWEGISGLGFHDGSFVHGGQTTYYGIATISDEQNYSSITTTELDVPLCSTQSARRQSTSANAVKADARRPLTLNVHSGAGRTAKTTAAIAVNR